MVIGHGVLGFRDPRGTRPLILGERRTARGTEYMLASENVALDMLSFKPVRDVAPGEAVFIDNQGRFHSQQSVRHEPHTPGTLAYVSLAHPGPSVRHMLRYRGALRMGERPA